MDLSTYLEGRRWTNHSYLVPKIGVLQSPTVLGLTVRCVAVSLSVAARVEPRSFPQDAAPTELNRTQRLNQACVLGRMLGCAASVPFPGDPLSEKHQRTRLGNATPGIGTFTALDGILVVVGSKDRSLLYRREPGDRSEHRVRLQGQSSRRAADRLRPRRALRARRQRRRSGQPGLHQCSADRYRNRRSCLGGAVRGQSAAPCRDRGRNRRPARVHPNRELVHAVGRRIACLPRPTANSERPERTAQRYGRFRCHDWRAPERGQNSLRIDRAVRRLQDAVIIEPGKETPNAPD